LGRQKRRCERPFASALCSLVEHRRRRTVVHDGAVGLERDPEPAGACEVGRRAALRLGLVRSDEAALVAAAAVMVQTRAVDDQPSATRSSDHVVSQRPIRRVAPFETAPRRRDGQKHKGRFLRPSLLENPLKRLLGPDVGPRQTGRTDPPRSRLRRPKAPVRKWPLPLPRSRPQSPSKEPTSQSESNQPPTTFFEARSGWQSLS